MLNNVFNPDSSKTVEPDSFSTNRERAVAVHAISV